MIAMVMIVFTASMVVIAGVRSVVKVRRSHRRTNGSGSAPRLQFRDEGAPLHPQQAQADENDEPIAQWGAAGELPMAHYQMAAVESQFRSIR
jgi:hypothetical protein